MARLKFFGSAPLPRLGIPTQARATPMGCVSVVCEDKGGEYGEYGKPNEVGHGGDVTPLALASDSREPFL